MYRNLPLPFLLSLWEHPSVEHKVSLPVKSRLLLVTLFPTLPVSFWSLVSGSPQWQLIQAMNLALIMLIPSVSVLNTGRGKGSYEFPQQWRLQLPLTMRESIPRQIDKKSGVPKERGVWYSQGGGKGKLFFLAIFLSLSQLHNSV